MTPDDAITVLIPTSPIRSHPSTDIIDATIASIRHWLPTARIIVMCDGVRPEMMEFCVRYDQYLAALRAKYGKRIVQWEFSEHRHQVAMTRRILPFVTTALGMFVEHDTGLVTDRPIDWQGIVNALLSGDVECIRFLNESRVDKHHLYLFEEQFEVCGVPLWKTRQWSQRPHVATVELYKRALAMFSPEANSMIEDRLMTFVEHQPWENWRCAVYIPGDNYHRSCHLDGRGTDSKFEAEMRF